MDGLVSLFATPAVSRREAIRSSATRGRLNKRTGVRYTVEHGPQCTPVSTRSMPMPEMTVRPLVREEADEFQALTTHVIGLWYDDIDDTFARIILDAHFKGHDPLGYFTKSKTIWVAEIDGEMKGFLVGTEKRGGSVKLAPGIMKPGFQGQGLGTLLWREVEGIYAARGARKIYNHAPLYRFELLKWVTSLGLKVEAHLSEHYRRGQDEYVASKLLRGGATTSAPIRRWSGAGANTKVRAFAVEDRPALDDLILGEMAESYGEIDTTFVDSIIDGEVRFGESFREKGKKLFLLDDGHALIGCCVGTPKRGGAVKLVPFLLKPELASPAAADVLLESVGRFFRDLGYRKLYAPIPVTDVDAVATFRRAGFEVEGFLREPYKAGIDNIFFGKPI